VQRAPACVATLLPRAHCDTVSVLLLRFPGTPCVGLAGAERELFFWDWKSGHNFQQTQTIVQPGEEPSSSHTVTLRTSAVALMYSTMLVTMSRSALHRAGRLPLLVVVLAEAACSVFSMATR